MFDDIGEKIQGFAVTVCFLGIIGSVILGIVTMLNNFFAGLITLVVGSLCSWIGSFFTYGFGEIILQNRSILSTNREILDYIKSSSVKSSPVSSSSSSFSSSSSAASRLNMEDRIAALAHHHSTHDVSWVCSECNASNPAGNNCCQSCHSVRRTRRSSNL